MNPTEHSFDEIYAAPKARLDHDGRYHVYGKFLVCQSPLVLPPRCVKTNAAGDGIVCLTRKFSGELAFTFRIARRSCEISYGLSDSVHRRLSLLLKITQICMVLGILLMFSPAFLGWGDYAPAVYIGALLVVVVSAAVGTNCVPLRVVRSSGAWFFVKGCSPEFLASIAADQPETAVPVGIPFA